MKQKMFALLALLFILAAPVLADTLYLKNGSVLKGAFIAFENGEFIFELGNGNRVKFRANEVSRLVLDNERNDPRDSNYPRRDPNTTPPATGGVRWEAQAPVDVRLAEQWVRTPITVLSGQRVRVEATGTVTLEGRTQVTPDGLANRRDPDAPMPDQNDGGLIAAVGQDASSPSIFIGRSREFVADREGVLYFTVNHWETANSRGAFRVTVSLDRNSGTPGGGPVSGGGGGQPTQGRTKTITVAANQPWTDTGIDLTENMTVEITAEGQIEIGARQVSSPDGNQNAKVTTSSYPLQDQGVGALIAKIRYPNGRDSNYVFIGSRSTPTTEANESGRLFLGINDDFFRDNNGSYRVTIRW